MKTRVPKKAQNCFILKLKRENILYNENYHNSDNIDDNKDKNGNDKGDDDGDNKDDNNKDDSNDISNNNNAKVAMKDWKVVSLISKFFSFIYLNRHSNKIVILIFYSL